MIDYNQTATGVTTLVYQVKTSKTPRTTFLNPTWEKQECGESHVPARETLHGKSKNAAKATYRPVRHYMGKARIWQKPRTDPRANTWEKPQSSKCPCTSFQSPTWEKRECGKSHVPAHETLHGKSKNAAKATSRFTKEGWNEYIPQHDFSRI